jgi:hypothetical protein
MTCLSIFDDRGVATIAANPIFPLDKTVDREGTEIVFEILEADATNLKDLVGKERFFSLDGLEPFFAKLQSLEPCTSTHKALRLMRLKPTLRGVLTKSCKQAANSMRPH